MGTSCGGVFAIARVFRILGALCIAIVEALKAASGKISGRSGAAERLGLKRQTLRNKMRKLNISKADYMAARPLTYLARPPDFPDTAVVSGEISRCGVAELLVILVVG
jgi:Bacterial regulatory protein, Fis family